MWWRKFVQYIKMTEDLDLPKMTNNKKILPQYRDQLEAEIKNIFLWAIGQNAITEMTKTIRKRENQAHYRYINYTHCSITFHTGEKRPTQQSQFLRPKTGRRRICGGCMETNTRSREKLRIWNNNRSRTFSIKIPIRDWEINGRLWSQKEDQKKRHVNWGNNRSITLIHVWKIKRLTRNRRREENQIPYWKENKGYKRNVGKTDKIQETRLQ